MIWRYLALNGSLEATDVVCAALQGIADEGTMLTPAALGLNMTLHVCAHPSG